MSVSVSMSRAVGLGAEGGARYQPGVHMPFKALFLVSIVVN